MVVGGQITKGAQCGGTSARDAARYDTHRPGCEVDTPDQAVRKIADEQPTSPVQRGALRVRNSR